MLYYFTVDYCTIHSLEKCCNCLTVIHAAQLYRCDMQAEERHISAKVRDLEQICRLLTNILIINQIHAKILVL